MKLTYKSPKLENKRTDRAFIHPELKKFMEEDWKEVLGLNAIGMVIIYIFFRDFAYDVIAFDLVLTTLWILLFGVMLPLMMNGKIKGYYRRSYLASNFLFVMKMFIHGTFVRTGMALALYGFIMFVVKRDRFTVEKYIELAKEEVLLNFTPQVFALLLFAFLVYYMFYREQYIEIPQYELRVRALQRVNGWSLSQASSFFLILRDEELEKGLEQRVEYKYNPSNVDSPNEMVKDNSQKRTVKTVQKPQEELIVVEKPIEENIRRRARRK